MFEHPPSRATLLLISDRILCFPAKFLWSFIENPFPFSPSMFAIISQNNKTWKLHTMGNALSILYDRTASHNEHDIWKLCGFSKIMFFIWNRSSISPILLFGFHFALVITIYEIYVHPHIHPSDVWMIIMKALLLIGKLFFPPSSNNVHSFMLWYARMQSGTMLSVEFIVLMNQFACLAF